MARQSRAPTLLLTRPLPQSQRFATDLAASWPDLAVEIAPLMAARYEVPVLPKGPFAAIILTSETGVEAARRISAAGVGLPDLAYCVGARTASTATAAGFAAISADGDAAALVALIKARRQVGRLLFLRGADSAGNVGSLLNSAGIETESVITYSQTPLPLTAVAVALLRGDAPVILPLFSPRSAMLFAAESVRIAATAPLWLAALSPAVLAAADVLCAIRTAVATRPDARSMQNAVAQLLVAGIGS